jgi:Putative MetA-pathway of phenol degradation
LAPAKQATEKNLKTSYLLSFTLCFSLSTVGARQAAAQDEDAGFFDQWFARERVDRALAEQPHWPAPVFTGSPRLEEMFVYDISRQDTAKGDVTNFGGTKGLLLIPSEHTNLVISPPPYLVHKNPANRDGFGDAAFLLRYRISASNEQHGNYVVTALVGGSIPTGSYTNGAAHAVVTPTIGAGKGWGKFDIQSTLGVGIPTRDMNRLGTPIVLNTAFQYQSVKKLWPELDVNMTFFPNGPKVGNKQVFLSPGLMVGRFHLGGRLGFAVGGGIQIAVTHFHTFNHNIVLTVRFPF